MSDDLFRGDRGPKGDHGQDGAAGQDGATGTTGQDGATGLTGAPGETGASGHDGASGVDGRASAWTPWRVKSVAGGVVGVLLIFGVALQVQQHQTAANTDRINAVLHAQAIAKYNACLQGVIFVHNLNEGYRQLIVVEKTTEWTTPQGQSSSDRRAAIYRSQIYSPEPTSAACVKPKQ